MVKNSRKKSKNMNSMKTIFSSSAILVIALGFAGCAEPAKMAAVTKAAPVGSRFEGTGRISLHDGEPCTPQIMFDFKPAGSSRMVWLAAPMHESKFLTEAANRHRSIHVSGTWHRGKDTGCSYVSVTKTER
jgi:hypothetical protein